MRYLLPLSAFAAVTFARTEVMLPLYVPPTSNDWNSAVAAIKNYSDLHFYVVINPNSGPKNTSDPEGQNGGACNIKGSSPCGAAIEHGCNEDWTTALNELNGLPNVQTIGYVWSRYGHEGPRPNMRTREDIKVDIDEWSQWNRGCMWNGQNGNITIHGIWFDETGVDPSNFTEYSELMQYARDKFSGRAGPVSIILNPGSNLSNGPTSSGSSYETEMFARADAVVLRETCFTSDPATANGDCPGFYVPFDYKTLSPGNGLPYHSELNSKAVVLVHQFHSPPEATVQTLKDQVKGVVGLGPHSTYFTSGTWHQTTLQSATVGAFVDALADANKGS